MASCSRCASGGGIRGGCGCGLIAGDGIHVAGTGSPGSPWIISVDPEIVTRVVDLGDGSFSYFSEDGTVTNIAICDLLSALPNGGTIPAGMALGLNVAGQCVIGTPLANPIYLKGQSGVTSTINAGETVRLVGAAGSGITTEGVAGDTIEIDIDICTAINELIEAEFCDVQGRDVAMVSVVDGACSLVNIPCRRYKLFSGPPASNGGVLTNGLPTLTDNGDGTVTFHDGVAASTTFTLCTDCGTALTPRPDMGSASVGQLSSINLAANDIGGTGAKTYNLQPGSSLPPGMNILPNGILSGTPTTPGSYTFTYVVVDSTGATATTTATVVISSQDLTPSLVNDTLSVVGCTPVTYDLLQNDMSLGNAPYTVLAIGGTAALPPGMQLSSTGVLSGSPTTPGIYSFTYQVTDADGDIATATMAMTVTSGTSCGQSLGTSDFSSTAGFTSVVGTMTAVGGRAVDTAGEFIARYGTPTPSNDMYAQVNVVFNTANPTSVWGGPSVRMSADGRTRYVLESMGNAGGVELIREVNGAQTSIGVSPTTLTAPGSNQLRLEVIGNVLRAYVNGGLVIGPIVDNVITGPAFTGVHLASSGLHALDDFRMGACSGGCAAPVAPTATNDTLSLRVGTAANVDLLANDAYSGVPTVSIISGSLPPNLQISSSGVITGTPTTVGSSTITYRVQTAAGFATATATIVVTSATARRNNFFYGGTGIFTTPFAQWTDHRLHPRSPTIAAALTQTGNRGLSTRDYTPHVVDVDPSGVRYNLIIRNDERNSAQYGISVGGYYSLGWNNTSFFYPNGVFIQPNSIEIPAGEDKHVVIRDWDNDRALHFYITNVDEGTRTIYSGWGGVYPANSDGQSDVPLFVYASPSDQALGRNLQYKATASGLSSLQGIITKADMERGYIDHALAFASDHARGPAVTPGNWVYPASANDGPRFGADAIEEGSRIILNLTTAQINAISHPGQRMVARALTEYGAILNDTSGPGTSMSFTCERPRAGNAADTALFASMGWSVTSSGYNDFGQIPWAASNPRIFIPANAVINPV